MEPIVCEKAENQECSENLLTCNCASCQSKKADKDNKSKSKINFMQIYGKEICKMLLSVLFLVLSVVFKEKEILCITFSLAGYLILTVEIFYDYVKGLVKGKVFNELALMLLASITSFALREYFEGVLIILLYSLGELLEDVATRNSRNKIAGLSSIKSEIAHLVDCKGMMDIEPAKVHIGSMIEVRNGEQVPIDSVLIGSVATLDVKAITGESRLCEVKNSENIYSGSINVGDPIYVKTTKLYKDSTVERIIQTVEGALAKKAKSQKFITSFAKIYTPIVGIVALLIAVLVPLIDGMNFTKWIYKALAFLVISCPCALVISVPLAYFVGIGSLAKIGIMVKGSKSIDMLAQTKVACFDKTGTLTKGNFVVEKVTVEKGYDEKLLLSYVSSVESKSNHPIAKAIVSFVGKSDLEAIDIMDIAGGGIVGNVEGKNVAIGNSKILERYNIKRGNAQGYGTSFYVLIDGNYVAEIVLNDEIKENASSLINDLKKYGVKKTIMLSGDRQAIAENVGNKVGIDKVYAQLLPDDKYNLLNKIKKERCVMYVGDGVNDSPSLALADVGVSMGGLGSDIAVSSSDVVIMDDNISKISRAVRFSKKIRRTVYQNIIVSLGIKFAIMAMSIFMNIPVYLAMFADVGTMLLAVINSLKNTKVR